MKRRVTAGTVAWIALAMILAIAVLVSFFYTPPAHAQTPEPPSSVAPFCADPAAQVQMDSLLASQGFVGATVEEVLSSSVSVGYASCRVWWQATRFSGEAQFTVSQAPEGLRVDLDEATQIAN